jgi:Mrp family chromosome partitioning ATPase
MVMFMSARSGEGASSVAASFALLAAEQARRAVWLIDVDLKRNHLFNTFAVGPFADAFGGVGPPYSAALKTQPFFSVEPEDPEAAARPWSLHGPSRWRNPAHGHAVRQGAAQAGQSIRIKTQPAYWQAVRAATDWAVVDAPALELAGAGLAIASQMDRVVIVVKALTTQRRRMSMPLGARVEAHGGRVAGVVLNREKPDARFADRISR